MVEGKRQWKAWLYLSPAIVLLLIFTVWPIVNTVRMAFLEDYNSLAAIGGATYSKVISRTADCGKRRCDLSLWNRKFCQGYRI